MCTEQTFTLQSTVEMAQYHACATETADCRACFMARHKHDICFQPCSFLRILHMNNTAEVRQHSRQDTNTQKHVCVQLTMYADNMALLAFACHCFQALTVQQSTGISVHRADSNKLAGRTDIILLHRFCLAQHVGSATKRQYTYIAQLERF